MSKLDGLHPYVWEKTEQLLKNANKRLTGDYEMRITQGYRSKAEQDALYAQGRTKPGKIVTNAKGGYSLHNFGLAVDFALFTKDGKKVVWDTVKDFDKDGTPDWQEVVLEAKKLGFEWGGDWKSFKDYPHFQLDNGLTMAQLRDGKKPSFPKLTAEKAEVKKDPVKTEDKKAVPAANPPYPGILFKTGSKGINVERIQRAVGMKEKDVKGLYDAKTVIAVKEYQKRKGLDVDGKVGVKSWNMMF